MNEAIVTTSEISPKEYEGEIGSVSEMLGQYERMGFKVTSGDAYQSAGEVLGWVKGKYAFLDGKRKEATKPIDVAKKIIMGWFKPTLERLEKAEKEIKQNMAEWQKANEVEDKAIEIRKSWTFKILDANKIPKKYMMPNEVMLQDIASQTQGLMKIAGVEFYEKEVVATKRAN